MAHLLALIEGSVGAHGAHDAAPAQVEPAGAHGAHDAAPAQVEPAVESTTWKVQLQAKRKFAQTAYAEANRTVKRMRANLRGRSRQLRLEKKMARRGPLAGPVLKERIKLMVACKMLRRQRAKAAAAEQDKMAAQRAWNSTQLRTQGSGKYFVDGVVRVGFCALIGP
jgi:hypothetical protein